MKSAARETARKPGGGASLGSPVSADDGAAGAFSSVTPLLSAQVYFLRGIEKLLPLLSSESESVQRVAAGALRNLVYQSGENKMEVKEKGGLSSVLQALRSSRDVETRRELTGQCCFRFTACSRTPR